VTERPERLIVRPLEYWWAIERSAAWNLIAAAALLLGLLLRSELAFDSVSLVHFAALTSVGRVTHGRCTSHPCDDPNSWSFDVLATDANPLTGQIGFQIDSAGKGRLVYSNALGVLTELREGGGGSPWTSRPLQDCGTTIVGTHPAFLLDEQDSMQLIYADASGVRYVVVP
jgi:hypothetical protein